MTERELWQRVERQLANRWDYCICHAITSVALQDIDVDLRGLDMHYLPKVFMDAKRRMDRETRWRRFFHPFQTNRGYYWPLTEKGRQQRIAFCQRMQKVTA